MKNFILLFSFVLVLLSSPETSSQTKLWGGSWVPASITVTNQKTTDSVLANYELPYTITEALMSVAVSSTYGDSLIIQVEGSHAYGSDSAWTILSATDSAKSTLSSTTYRQYDLVTTFRYMRVRGLKKGTTVFVSYAVKFLPRRFYDTTK